jgi:hypothetical protein
MLKHFIDVKCPNCNFKIMSSEDENDQANLNTNNNAIQNTNVIRIHNITSENNLDRDYAQLNNDVQGSILNLNNINSVTNVIVPLQIRNNQQSSHNNFVS